MSLFLVAFKTVLPLFLVIFVGVLFSRTKNASIQWVEILNKYALYVGFPALLIASLMHLDLEGGSYLNLIILNSAYILISIALVFPVSRIFRMSTEMKRMLFLIFPFGNVAYLGIPVLSNALGEEILPIVAVISAVYLFWLMTLALVLIEIYGTSRTTPKKMAISLASNPLLLSVLVGLAIVLFQINIPEFAERTIGFFADSVTAIVLFSLGIFMGMQKIGNLKDWGIVLLYSVVSMIVLPLLFYGIIIFTGIETPHLNATVLEAAMPMGLTPYALSVQYKLKTTLAARVVVLATLLSIVIIPLWMVILN